MRYMDTLVNPSESSKERMTLKSNKGIIPIDKTKDSEPLLLPQELLIQYDSRLVVPKKLPVPVRKRIGPRPDR